MLLFYTLIYIALMYYLFNTLILYLWLTIFLISYYCNKMFNNLTLTYLFKLYWFMPSILGTRCSSYCYCWMFKFGCRNIKRRIWKKKFFLWTTHKPSFIDLRTWSKTCIFWKILWIFYLCGSPRNLWEISYKVCELSKIFYPRLIEHA